MSSIYADLELPVNVVIKFNFVPRPLTDKVARRLEEVALVREARRALVAWYCDV
jgi:hypothetical protein